MAATEAIKEVIWLLGLTDDLGVGQDQVHVMCDSQSAIHLARNQVYYSWTKHIDVCFYFVRKIIEEWHIFLCKISTLDNPTDMLTKVVSEIKFQHCLELIHCLKLWKSFWMAAVQFWRTSSHLQMKLIVAVKISSRWRIVACWLISQQAKSDTDSTLLLCVTPNSERRETEKGSGLLFSNDGCAESVSYMESKWTRVRI